MEAFLHQEARGFCASSLQALLPTVSGNAQKLFYFCFYPFFGISSLNCELFLNNIFSDLQGNTKNCRYLGCFISRTPNASNKSLD